MNSITYTFGEDHATVTLSLEQIRERLGSEATDQDAQAFCKAWNTRFFDAGKPDFDAEDDRDATWIETLVLAGLA